MRQRIPHKDFYKGYIGVAIKTLIESQDRRSIVTTNVMVGQKVQPRQLIPTHIHRPTVTERTLESLT